MDQKWQQSVETTGGHKCWKFAIETTASTDHSYSRAQTEMKRSTWDGDRRRRGSSYKEVTHSKL